MSMRFALTVCHGACFPARLFGGGVPSSRSALCQSRTTEGGCGPVVAALADGRGGEFVLLFPDTIPAVEAVWRGGRGVDGLMATRDPKKVHVASGECLYRIKSTFRLPRTPCSTQIWKRARFGSILPALQASMSWRISIG